MLAVPALTGCIDNSLPVSLTEPELNGFASAVAMVNQDSTSVEVTEWTTGNKVTFTRDNPNFTEILRLLNASTTKQVTSKSAIVVENGKTVTVQRTIPYPMGFIMTFDLKDGSKVKFNVTSDNIWFETDEAIYQASVSPDLYSLLKEWITNHPPIHLDPPPKPTPLEVGVSRLSIHSPVAIPGQQAYSYARMMFEFKIHNPNNVAIKLEKFEYAVYGDGHVVAGADRMVSGEYPDRVIESYGTTDVEFPLPYISKDENPTLWSEMAKGTIIWTIKGVAHIRTPTESLSVPFECIVKNYSLSIENPPTSSPSAMGDSASIAISPSLGSYLTNSQNVSSEVLLKDVQVNKGISDNRYISPWYPAHTVNIGEPILVVSGSVQNKHEENKEIAMYAEGFDDTGKQVSWTLDAAHIAGQIGLHLENEETGQFTLHLNTAENIKSIRIFANNYSVTPP